MVKIIDLLDFDVKSCKNLGELGLKLGDLLSRYDTYYYEKCGYRVGYFKKRR